MITRKVNSQGFELQYNVPETIEEYNNLAPKRTNPVLEDAIQNVLYRNVFNKFRDGLCEVIEKVTGIARINTGTADDPVWESEGKYLKRVQVEVAKSRGLDPAAKATRETILGEWQSLANAVLNGGTVSYTNKEGVVVLVTLKAIPFDPTEREPSAGPGLAKTYIAWAKDAISKGIQDRLAALLSKATNETVTLTGDAEKDTEILARAIAAREKIKRDEQARQSRIELGLEEATA